MLVEQKKSKTMDGLKGVGMLVGPVVVSPLAQMDETSPTQSAPETENEMEQDVPPDSSTLVLELLALAEMAVPVSVPATFATPATQ